MPNGGVMPSCNACQYARKAGKRDEIECRKHSMKVTFASLMFCTDLSHLSSPGLANFAQDSRFSPDTMYVWGETGFMSRQTGLPEYIHEPLLLAPISTYTAWSDKEKEIEWRAKTKTWEKNFFEENTIEENKKPKTGLLSKLLSFLGRRQRK